MNARPAASRHIAAYVAQYIHELSERHADARDAVAAPVVAAPRAA